MAIITVSRQIASFGDEVAAALAESFGYAFVTRAMLEADLVKYGLTEEHLHKYDERKPGFWASLARDRDEYFDYLREAVYERAKTGNCVLVGRGGFAILKDVPGCYSVRLVASESVRIERLMKEFSWPERNARALLQESDANRNGFHKCFFNIDHEDPTGYHLVINTGFLTPKTGAEIVREACSRTIAPELEAAGVKRVGELLQAQKLVNHIVFDLKTPVHFLEATATANEIILHGVADSPVVIDKVLSIAHSMVPGKKVTSAIGIVQDYKSYP